MSPTAFTQRSLTPSGVDSDENVSQPKMVVVRVAIIAESFLPQVNGVTNSVLRVLEHLRAGGHDALVICPDHPDGVPSHYQGFPIVTLGSMTLLWYQSMRIALPSVGHLERILEEFDPDVVHLAAPFLLGSRGVAAAARLSIPSVALYQTDVPGYIGLYGFPQAERVAWKHVRRLHNLATMTLAPSTFTAHQLEREGIARVGVWARGVDSERFQPSRRDEALHDSWAPNGERVIGYLGRIAAEKRVQDLVELADLPGTKLVIVGEGPQRDELEALLPNAIFTGQQTGDALPRHLASFDLFVHTGDLDTFGQTIQEAQASGLPVVAPGQGGPIDLVDSSRTGWLYPPGDLVAMKSYVRDLVGDDAKREAMGRAACETVRTRTWPAICDQLLEHYRDAIRLGARAARGVLIG